MPPAPDKKNQPKPDSGKKTAKPQESKMSPAEMPDWLARISDTNPAESTGQPAADNQAPEDGAMPQWLQDLRASAQESAQADATPDSSGVDDLGIPDWLTSTGAQSQVGDETSGGDAAAPEMPQSEYQAQEVNPEEQAELQPESGEMPDWIRAMSPGNVSPTDISQKPGMVDESDTEGMPDWMQRLKPPDSPPAAPATASESNDVDWEAALRAENEARLAEARQHNAEFLAELESSQKAAELEATLETAPESELEQAALAEEVPEEGTAMPDWVRELMPPAGIQGRQGAGSPIDESDRKDLPDWLREAVPGGSPLGGPTLPGPASEGESGLQVPAWMSELRPVADGRPDAASRMEEVTEGAGPLAGVRGVLPASPIVTQPHMLAAAAAVPGSGARIFESVLAARQEVTAPVGVAQKRGLLSARHWIYLAILFAALIPVLVLQGDNAGLGVIAQNTPLTDERSTAGFFAKLKALSTDSTVLMAFDYEPGQSMEMDPAAHAIVGYLSAHNVNAIAVSTTPAGPRMAQDILASGTAANPNWKQGQNYVNAGLIPGQEKGLNGLSRQWLNSTQSDFEGNLLSQSSLASRVKGFNDLALVIVLAGSDEALRPWMQQVQPNVRTPFVGAVSAAVDLISQNDVGATQLAATMPGLAGTAEFELLSGQPALAAHLADAQSFVQLAVFAIIVIANLGVLLDLLRKRRTAAAE
ncbi:MAG: hypothetical protein WCF84_08785 [Anaerolineae bacterium]